MKWLWIALVAMPTTIAAQTYTACPTPSTKILSVSAGGITATSKINVVDIPAPTPFVEERYGYASVAQFSEAPNTGTVYGLPANLELEKECGALRYKFVPRMVNVCEKYYSGYDLKFPQEVGEVFVEVWARFDPEFEPQRPRADSTQCARTSFTSVNQSGFTFLHGRVNNTTGSFRITLGTAYPYGLRAAAETPSYLWVSNNPSKQGDEEDEDDFGGGGNILNMQYMGHVHKNKIEYGNGYHIQGDTRYRDEFGNALMRFDGKWHRYRFWFRAANGRYPNGGSIGVWVDDDHLGSLPIQDTLADKIIGLSIGRLMWDQPRKQQYVDYGRVRVWTTNPGWNICQVFCMDTNGLQPGVPPSATVPDEPDEPEPEEPEDP